MSEQPIQNSDNQYSRLEFEQRMRERRKSERIPAFCQVLDLSGEFVGVSFDLTPNGICCSLPRSWPRGESFSIILKRKDSEVLPEVRVTVKPVWRNFRNEQYDEIGGQILELSSEQDFQSFLAYCEEMGPSGLFPDD